ncbi:hypothetical protein PLICRDRAFT_696755 [Plicaturopsis crispa FD-325 SS-3]|nr:hypothetical protein PLICRDRAFT_696755 [Plicaturopsis crispa FD-325 SS-3]
MPISPRLRVDAGPSPRAQGPSGVPTSRRHSSPDFSLPPATNCPPTLPVSENMTTEGTDTPSSVLSAARPAPAETSLKVPKGNMHISIGDETSNDQDFKSRKRVEIEVTQNTSAAQALPTPTTCSRPTQTHLSQNGKTLAVQITVTSDVETGLPREDQLDDGFKNDDYRHATSPTRNQQKDVASARTPALRRMPRISPQVLKLKGIDGMPDCTDSKSSPTSPSCLFVNNTSPTTPAGEPPASTSAVPSSTAAQGFSTAVATTSLAATSSLPSAAASPTDDVPAPGVNSVPFPNVETDLSVYAVARSTSTTPTGPSNAGARSRSATPTGPSSANVDASSTADSIAPADADPAQTAIEGPSHPAVLEPPKIAKSGTTTPSSESSYGEEVPPGTGLMAKLTATPMEEAGDGVWAAPKAPPGVSPNGSAHQSTNALADGTAEAHSHAHASEGRDTSEVSSGSLLCRIAVLEGSAGKALDDLQARVNGIADGHDRETSFGPASEVDTNGHRPSPVDAGVLGLLASLDDALAMAAARQEQMGRFSEGGMSLYSTRETTRDRQVDAGPQHGQAASNAPHRYRRGQPPPSAVAGLTSNLRLVWAISFTIVCFDIPLVIRRKWPPKEHENYLCVALGILIWSTIQLTPMHHAPDVYWCLALVIISCMWQKWRPRTFGDEEYVARLLHLERQLLWKVTEWDRTVDDIRLGCEKHARYALEMTRVAKGIAGRAEKVKAQADRWARAGVDIRARLPTD